MTLFKRKPTPTDNRKGHWRAFVADGVAFAARRDDLPKDGIGACFLDNQVASELLTQLEDDGRLTGSKTLPWGDVYDLLEGAEQREIRHVLALPEIAAYVPALVSRDSLRDPTFDILVHDWRTPDAVRASYSESCGAVIVDGDDVGMLPRTTWEMLDQVERFRRRPNDEHAEAGNRRHWGRIRRAALAAGARLDDFLLNTVVLTPDKLQIGLRKDKTSGTTVVEVAPTFDGAPERWLEAFDAHGRVLDRYNIPTVNGIVAIEIAPTVRNVLDNIKRMPGRRVAGPRAEAFLVNPFAALGEERSETIDETQFMEAREKADLLFDRFFARIEKDAFGRPDGGGVTDRKPEGQRAFRERDQAICLRRRTGGFRRRSLPLDEARIPALRLGGLRLRNHGRD